MTSKESAQDKELLERYRRASDTEAAAPSEAVRTAILAEGRRVAELRAKEVRGRPFDASRPAANDSRWKMTAFGTAGAALVVALLFAPRLWESAPPALSVSNTAQPPKPESLQVSPNSSPPLQEIVVTQARENSKSAGAASPIAAQVVAPKASAPARMASMRSVPQPVALQSAAALGDTAQTTALLNQGAALDARDEHGRTPLMLAVMQSRVDVVRLLLNRGADPNIADGAGRTPLQQAKQENLHEIAALLKRAGAR
jgi:ankyrin repeat protein